MTHTGVGTTQKYRCAYIRTPRTYITVIGPPLVSISLCSVVSPTDGVVQNEAYIEDAEEPGGSGRIGAIKLRIDHPFDGLVEYRLFRKH
jgi:hypothetical protein